MSNKSQKRDYYYHRMSVWRNHEPPRWRIFKWLKWYFSRPKPPKWLDKWEQKQVCKGWW